MRKTLLLVLFFTSLLSFAQVDSVGRFYASERQLTWRADFSVYQLEAADIKKFLVIKLDSYQGVEITDTTHATIITGKLDRVVAQNGRFISKDTQGSYSGDFTIDIGARGYSVKLTHLEYFIKLSARTMAITFETLFLKRNGNFVKSAKKNSLPIDTFFENTFKW